jgi:RNA-binding protein
MQDCGHATPSENRSPAGKAQNCAPSGIGIGKADLVERNARGIEQFMEAGALVVLMRTARFGFKTGWRNTGPASRDTCVAAGRRHPGPRWRHLQSLQLLEEIWVMELSERQRKYLRGLGHALNPVLLIGQHGITPAVIAEAIRALHDHELIKVKFRGADREGRDAGLAQLATATGGVLLQRIGHTALYYKRRIDRPGIVIPDS